MYAERPGPHVERLPLATGSSGLHERGRVPCGRHPVRLNDRFPKEPPTIYLQLPFERTLGSASDTAAASTESAAAAQDAGVKLENVPYSPRWTPEDMVARFLYACVRVPFGRWRSWV